MPSSRPFGELACFLLLGVRPFLGRFLPNFCGRRTSPAAFFLMSRPPKATRATRGSVRPRTDRVSVVLLDGAHRVLGDDDRDAREARAPCGCRHVADNRASL